MGWIIVQCCHPDAAAIFTKPRRPPCPTLTESHAIRVDLHEIGGAGLKADRAATVIDGSAGWKARQVEQARLESAAIFDLQLAHRAGALQHTAAEHRRPGSKQRSNRRPAGCRFGPAVGLLCAAGARQDQHPWAGLDMAAGRQAVGDRAGDAGILLGGDGRHAARRGSHCRCSVKAPSYSKRTSAWSVRAPVPMDCELLIASVLPTVTVMPPLQVLIPWSATVVAGERADRA